MPNDVKAKPITASRRLISEFAYIITSILNTEFKDGDKLTTKAQRSILVLALKDAIRPYLDRCEEALAIISRHNTEDVTAFKELRELHAEGTVDAPTGGEPHCGVCGKQINILKNPVDNDGKQTYVCSDYQNACRELAERQAESEKKEMDGKEYRYLKVLTGPQSIRLILKDEETVTIDLKEKQYRLLRSLMDQHASTYGFFLEEEYPVLADMLQLEVE
ncbi:MAG: hypothetical protein QME66_05415 [Candidatus Eisenbacteria bacterium]|nr:hypothetical protein [Candidatus Eisenbacteria bacterium]